MFPRVKKLTFRDLSTPLTEGRLVVFRYVNAQRGRYGGVGSAGSCSIWAGGLVVYVGWDGFSSRGFLYQGCSFAGVSSLSVTSVMICSR